MTEYDPSGTVQQSHFKSQSSCLPQVIVIVIYSTIISRGWEIELDGERAVRNGRVVQCHLTWLKSIRYLVRSVVDCNTEP